MKELPYNRKDKSSVIEYTKRLIGKTLRQLCEDEISRHQFGGKGNFGQLLEKYYFLYENNSKPEADFKEIGLELKSSPLKQLKSNGFRSKERLVLNIINYNELINQEFYTSEFWSKNKGLLLVFYLHELEVSSIDYIIKIVGEWQYPPTDLEVIKKDWEIIKAKVDQGKAHELSEGDTFYLGACTKGANAQSTRSQPFSAEPAKQRAFSLKQGYVNHIIASISNDNYGKYGKLISSLIPKQSLTIEEVVISKFKPFYGYTIKQLIDKFDLGINSKAKSFYSMLTNSILGIELDKKVEEFEKADIQVKTIRLKENNLPKEDISFPAFKFEDVAFEDWDDSDFKECLERKFLFVFFQFENENLKLRKVKFWNMPYSDILEAKKVWEKTKNILLNGLIVNEIKGKMRKTNFPGKTFNHVAHVRPHAINRDDTFQLPVRDKKTGATDYTKQSFWLNNSYVRDNIYLDLN
jgi:DNA mismatch repair protein MutH